MECQPRGFVAVADFFFDESLPEVTPNGGE